MTRDKLYLKALNNDFLNFEEAFYLYQNAPLHELMFVANQIRKNKHPDNLVGWIIDRNVNITNVCISGCKFCNFHCKPSESDKAYVTSFDEYVEKIKELYQLGGRQLLLQGGLNPRLKLSYYEKLFSSLKNEFPELKLHALGPPEIAYLAKMDKLSHKIVLQRLVEAGLDSLPGAGAEILNDRIRKSISPGKCSAEEWLEVMSQAHKLNMITSATMMYGHVETLEDRIIHLLRIRDLQNDKPNYSNGFTTFIAWPFQSKFT